MVETKKILRSRGVTFVEDSMSQRASVDGPSGRFEDNKVVVDQPNDTPIVGVEDEVEEHDALETVKSKKGEKERIAASSSAVEEDSSLVDRCYPDRVRRLLGEWWKNHIMTINDEEHANVVLLNGPLTIREAMKCVDANKCEQAIQEEYKLLIANGIWELTLMPYNRSPSNCLWVFRAKRDATGHVVRYKA